MRVWFSSVRLSYLVSSQVVGLEDIVEVICFNVEWNVSCQFSKLLNHFWLLCAVRIMSPLTLVLLQRGHRLRPAIATDDAKIPAFRRRRRRRQRNHSKWLLGFDNGREAGCYACKTGWEWGGLTGGGGGGCCCCWGVVERLFHLITPVLWCTAPKMTASGNTTTPFSAGATRVSPRLSSSLQCIWPKADTIFAPCKSRCLI